MYVTEYFCWNIPSSAPLCDYWCEVGGTCTCVIVEELDVPVLLSRDGDWQRGMTQHFVDLAGRFCAGEEGRKDNISI